MRVLFIAMFFLLAGCEKNNDNTGDITSRWKETDHYFSVAGPIEWHRTEPQNAETLEFRKDSAFYSSAHPKLNGYRIEASSGSTSAKLKLFEAGKTDTTYWLITNLTQNSLTVGFFGCVEGCGKKFVRVEGD